MIRSVGVAGLLAAAVVLDAPSQAGEAAASHAGVAYADITTGEFATTEIPLESLRAELTRLHPAEILKPDNFPINDGLPGHLTTWPAWRFEPGRSQEALLSHFQAATLDGFGLRGQPLAVRAAGAILQYLQETRREALSLLTSLRLYSLSEFMTLDAATRRNLELTETIRGGRVKGAHRAPRGIEIEYIIIR